MFSLRENELRAVYPSPLGRFRLRGGSRHHARNQPLHHDTSLLAYSLSMRSNRYASKLLRVKLEQSADDLSLGTSLAEHKLDEPSRLLTRVEAQLHPASCAMHNIAPLI